MTAAKREPNPPLMTTPEASAYLNVAVKTMRSWRERGEGPPFIRLNDRLVRYRVRDLDEWIDSQAVSA